MARHFFIPSGFRRVTKKSDFTVKKQHIIAVAITLASGMSAISQDAAAPSLSKLEALAKLTMPLVVHDATGFQADGAVRPIFFDALDWEGKPTRVFAWIGLPAGASMEKPAPYINAIQEHFPHADIIHDKFHISQHPGNAVDKTRRIEHAKLQKQGDESLTKTKYLWLKSMENPSDEALSKIKELGRCEFEVSKAWYLKELFKHFWSSRDKDCEQRYFKYWEKEVASSGVEEMKKVARMLRRHLANILTYFDSDITNAFSEGINSKIQAIQAIKANARGFRNFKNYRTRILFFCGKLSLAP